MRFCILYLSITKFTGIVMKTLLSLTFIILLSALYLGCDSATDSKSISVTAPGLVQPANNDTMVAAAPLFKWTNNADQLQIDVNSSFEAPFYSTAVTGNEFQLPAGILSPSTFYYWRAGNTVGGTTYWSQDRFFFRTRPN